MSSVESQDPVQLNVFQRDLVPSSDLQAKALKLNLSDGNGAEVYDKKLLKEKSERDAVTEDVKKDLLLVTESREKTDQEKVVNLDDQATKADAYLCEGQFKETTLDSAKDFTQGNDLDKELLDGYLVETVEEYAGGYEDNSYVLPITEDYYSQETIENTDDFQLDDVPRQRSSRLDILEESELVIDSETDFAGSIKEKIFKRKESSEEEFNRG